MAAFFKNYEALPGQKRAVRVQLALILKEPICPRKAPLPRPITVKLFTK